MKKILSILITVFLTATLVGCSQSTKNEKVKDQFSYLAIVGRNLIDDPYANSLKKYGLIDENFNEILPMEYDSICIEDNGFITVQQKDEESNNSVGLYDYQGNEIIPCEYAYILGVESNSKVLVASKDYGSSLGYSLIDRKGNLIIPENKYDEINVTNMDNIFYFHSSENQKYGLINEFGEEIVPAKYDYYIDSFSQNGLARVKSNDKYGYIDESGNEIIPCVYMEALDFNESDFTFVVTQDHELQIINSKNEILVDLGNYDDLGYTPISPFNKNGFAIVLDESQHCGVIDHEGKIQLELKYDEIKYNDETETYLIKKNNLYGLYDKNLKEILPIKYDYINYKNTDSYITAGDSYDDLKMSYIFDSKGKWIAEIDEEKIYECEQDYCVVTSEIYSDIGNDMVDLIDVYNYVDKNGEYCGKGPLEKSGYYNAYGFSENGLAAVQIEKNKWSFIDKNFDVISEQKYDEVEYGFEPVNITKYNNLVKQQEKYSEEYKEKNIDQSESTKSETGDLLPISSNEQAIDYLKSVLYNPDIPIQPEEFRKYDEFDIQQEFDGYRYYIYASSLNVGQGWVFQISPDGAIYDGTACIYAPDGNPSAHMVSSESQALEILKNFLRQNTPDFDELEANAQYQVTESSWYGIGGYDISINYWSLDGTIEYQEYYFLDIMGDLTKIDNHTEPSRFVVAQGLI